MKPIDYGAINRRLLSDAESFVRELLPGGRRVGNEYVCADIHGGEGRSFSVNLNTGIFADFAAKISGKDLVSLYARVKGLGNAAAAREIEKRWAGAAPEPQATNKPPVQQKPSIIAPPNAPDPDFVHPTHGRPTATWKYRNANGDTMMYVARYDPPTGKKQFCPFTFDGKRWNKRGWRDPQPLYGLDDLKLRPEASVIVVEGEKATDNARTFAPWQVVVTWPGGSQRWHTADWSPLHGRRVVLWPDNDEPGLTAMRGIASALMPHCPEVKIFDVADRPEGWDAADAVAAGWDRATFATWAQTHIGDVQKALTPLTAGVEVSGNGHGQLPSFYSKWIEWSLDCNGNGTPHANINNAVTILEHDPTLRDIVWFDSFLQKFRTGTPAREWTDADDIHLALYMQRNMGISKMGIETIRSSIQEIGLRRPRHSVRDWIDSLKWDGVPRIDHFFVDHFGAVKNAYNLAAARTFWLSMLARVYRPGCKVDSMIVFEGEQGNRKSMALQIIGGEWWSEEHENVTGKAFFEVLQGKLLIEIGEMDAFTRADITRVKQVVTCPTDRFREPYARYAADHPRQCIFAGNTNRDDYLKDETGARRFLPVRTAGQIDVDAIAHNRDQYFAEARHRLAPDTTWDPKLWHFSGGEDWWSMPSGETLAEQRDRLQEDPWQEIINHYIYNEKMGDQQFPRAKPLDVVTVNEILLHVLHIEIPRIQRADERRVGACLTALGWRKHVGRLPDEEQPRKIWKRIVEP